MKDIIITFIAVITLGTITWVGKSAIEAHTYTRVTGKQVTILDAMFIDLRVVDGVK
jgi:hypothetical protein